jgi:hypothetical protein
MTHTSHILQRVKSAKRAELPAHFPDRIEINTNRIIFRGWVADKKSDCGKRVSKKSLWLQHITTANRKREDMLSN